MKTDFAINKDFTVLLDAGHGKETSGKRSPDGQILEYAYCRKLVNAINDKLKNFCNPIILVPEDSDIPLQERVKRANAYYKKYGKNCVLLSIHINASSSGQWGTASGWSVFVSKNASQKSKDFARILTDNAIGLGIMGNRSIPKEKYWTWSWTSNDIYILKSSLCPAVLTENMFMDNKKDVEFLLSNEGFNKLVDLHVQAVRELI